MTYFWWGISQPFDDARACLYTITVEEGKGSLMPFGTHGVQQHWSPYSDQVAALLSAGAREITFRTAFEMGWPV